MSIDAFPQRQATLERFRVAPVGSFTSGEGWMHMCWAPTFFAVCLWGRPSPDAAARLIESLRVELDSSVPAHDSLVDASRVDGVDAAAFELLNQYVSGHHAELTQKVRRLALVRPAGLAGAVTAGFYEVLDAPYPVELFGRASDALAWLGVDDAAGSAAALSARVDTLSGTPALLRRLHAHIASSLHGDCKAGARALGLSERSLQRRLREHGTTYQRELGLARIERAKRAMRESDAPLTRIALDCGFASIQSFSALFRKLEGQSPSEWRSELRDR